MREAAAKDPREVEEETRKLQAIHCTEHAAAMAPTKLCVKMVTCGGLPISGIRVSTPGLPSSL